MELSALRKVANLLEEKTRKEGRKISGVRQISELCGVSRQTVDNWLRIGRMDAAFVPLLSMAVNHAVTEVELCQSALIQKNFKEQSTLAVSKKI